MHGNWNSAKMAVGTLDQEGLTRRRGKRKPRAEDVQKTSMRPFFPQERRLKEVADGDDKR